MAYNRLRRFFPFAEQWYASRCNSPSTTILKQLLNRLFGRTRRLSIFLIEGTVSGDRSTALFLGNMQKAHQLACALYSETTKISTLGTTLACHASQADPSQVDAIMIDARNHDIKKLQRLGYLILPNISFTLDLQQPTDQIRRAMSRRRRRDIRGISQQNYGYVISTHRVQDFDFFIWKMYLPYATKRFSKAAMLSPYDILKGYYKGNGGIVFVTKHKKPLAGILFQIRKDTIYALVYGVYDGDAGFVKNQAGTAALHFLIKWAKNKGLSWLDYGRTVPFFNDGIFTYKKEWGMTIKPHHEQPYCALKLNPTSKKAISLLQKKPFIIYDKGALRGCVIHDSRPRKEELKSIWARHYSPGLDSLTLLFYDYNTHTCRIKQFPNKDADFQNSSKSEEILKVLMGTRQATHPKRNPIG